MATTIRPLRTGSGKLVMEHPGFGGGYVCAKAFHELSEDQFFYGQDAEIDVVGRVRKRGGWLKLISSSLGANGIKGLYEFRDNAGNAELFAVHYKSGTGMQLKRKSGSAWKDVRVALRGPVGVAAALNGSGGGAQFTVSDHYLYAVAAESAGLTYANSQPAEVAYVQQANPVQEIKVTWKALRYAESYRVYRYHATRGWEKFDSLVTATELVDTGSLAVTAAEPSTLPVDVFAALPGFSSASEANDVGFATFNNNMVFGDGRSLYRTGEYGIDLLPTQWQNFESSIPISHVFTSVAGGVTAYSTSIAYDGTKSVQLTTTASGDGADVKWPLKGALANGEVVRAKGRYIALQASQAKQLTVRLSVLDAGGSELQSTTATLSPQLVWKEFSLSLTVNTASGASLRVRITQATADAAVVYLDDMHLLVDAGEVIRPYVPTVAEETDPGKNLLLTTSEPVWMCKKFAAHANRLWLADHPTEPGRSYYTDLLDYGYIPAPYYALAETHQDDRITVLVEHRERLILYTRDTMQRITGSGPSDYDWALVNDVKGCIAPFSVASVDNYLVWVARDGIYLAKTVDGIQDYLDVVRISDPIQPAVDKFVNRARAFGVYHDGQYKLAIPDGTQVPAAPDHFYSATANMMLRWYRPGDVRAKAIWAPPDYLGVPISHLVVGQNGTLYGANPNDGLVYYYAPTTYNDDGAAILMSIQKQYFMGDHSRSKELYWVRVKGAKQSSTDRTLGIEIASTGGYESKSVTFKGATVTDILRGIWSEWQEIETAQQASLFTATFSNSTLNAGVDVQAVALVFRNLRG